MGREIDRLSARRVVTAGAGFHADGGGLYLRVDASGARRWVFVFRYHGRRKEMGFGPLVDIPLAVARELAQQARAQVKAGKNPIDERRRQRASVVAMPFGQLADEFIEAMSPRWRSKPGLQQWKTTLKVDAKKLRLIPVSEVTTDDVLAVLRPIWNDKPETARRLRGRIERVLDAGKARGMRAGDNPARWRGHLDLLLPQRQKLVKGHHPALPYPQMPEFLRALRRSVSLSAAALDFTILTNARTSEAILAKGTEFDLDAAVWTVPGERMKSGRPHRVPLTTRALEIVKTRIELGGDGYLFPGLKRGKALSNGALTKMLKDSGYGEFTVHGFRSSFRDWGGDRTTFPREIIEAAMAHVVGDEAEQAYRRSDALERRRQLMNEWAKYCDQPAGQVIKIA